MRGPFRRAGGRTIVQSTSLAWTLSVHMIPVLVWKGATETEAAWAYGVESFLGIITRILIGAWGDWLPKNLVVAGGMLVGIVGLLELLLIGDSWSIWVCVVTFSVMDGVIPLNWAIVGDYFGRAKFATLRGNMGLIYTWGAIIGPVAAGASFDSSESYAATLWAMIGFFGAGAVVFAFLRPPRQSPPVPAVSTGPAGG